jgi:SAM-dependent methyltransferase
VNRPWSRSSDPEWVKTQYASEEGLAARLALYEEVSGPDARQMVLDAVAEAHPRQVLEVGCGQGELARRLGEELGISVVAIDQSPRMVEIARGRGVDARVGDVQALPFDDASFDVVVAAWMLYHVPDLDRGIAELARVLRPGGQLVAAANHPDHLYEMFALVGLDEWALPFDGANGAATLARAFDSVEQRDADGTVTVRDADAIRSYLGSAELLREYSHDVPELDGPLVVRRRPVVFVAHGPR